MTAPTRNKNAARAATKPTDKSLDEAVEAVEVSAAADPGERPDRARRRRPTADDSARVTTDDNTGSRRRAASRRAASTDADPSTERRARRGTRSRAASAADEATAEQTRSRTGRARSSSRSEASGASVASRGARSRSSAGTDVDGVSAGSRRSRSGGTALGEPEVPVRTHGGVADPTIAGTATATVDAPAKPARTPSVDRPERVTDPSRPRTAAAERAYARRAHRDGHGSVARAKVADEEVAAGRASFVVLIMALLAVGVAATLWLTTQAVADSYRLEHAKEEANRLAEQAAQLQREVTKKESASVLAERARQLGMVPAGDPARIVVGPDGAVTVVGEAKPVQAPAPPPAPPADPAAGTQPPPGADTRPPADGTQPPPAADAQPPAAGAPPAGATPPAAGQTVPDGAGVPAPGTG